LTLEEPRLGSYVARLYDTAETPASARQIAAIGERCRPFRTSAEVLVRVAGDRLSLAYAPAAAVSSAARANAPRRISRGSSTG